MGSVECPNCKTKIPGIHWRNNSQAGTRRLKRQLAELGDRWYNVVNKINHLNCAQHVNLIAEYLDEVIELLSQAGAEMRVFVTERASSPIPQDTCRLKDWLPRNSKSKSKHSSSSRESATQQTRLLETTNQLQLAFLAALKSKLPEGEQKTPQAEMSVPPVQATTEPQTEDTTKPQTEAATEPQTEATTEPQTETATEPQAQAATDPQAQTATVSQAQSTLTQTKEPDITPQDFATHLPSTLIQEFVQLDSSKQQQIIASVKTKLKICESDLSADGVTQRMLQVAEDAKHAKKEKSRSRPNASKRSPNESREDDSNSEALSEAAQSDSKEPSSSKRPKTDVTRNQQKEVAKATDDARESQDSELSSTNSQCKEGSERKAAKENASGQSSRGGDQTSRVLMGKAYLAVKKELKANGEGSKEFFVIATEKQLQKLTAVGRKKVMILRKLYSLAKQFLTKSGNKSFGEFVNYVNSNKKVSDKPSTKETKPKGDQTSIDSSSQLVADQISIDESSPMEHDQDTNDEMPKTECDQKQETSPLESDSVADKTSKLEGDEKSTDQMTQSEDNTKCPQAHPSSSEAKENASLQDETNAAHSESEKAFTIPPVFSTFFKMFKENQNTAGESKRERETSAAGDAKRPKKMSMADSKLESRVEKEVGKKASAGKEAKAKGNDVDVSDGKEDKDDEGSAEGETDQVEKGGSKEDKGDCGDGKKDGGCNDDDDHGENDEHGTDDDSGSIEVEDGDEL